MQVFPFFWGGTVKTNLVKYYCINLCWTVSKNILFFDCQSFWQLYFPCLISELPVFSKNLPYCLHRRFWNITFKDCWFSKKSPTGPTERTNLLRGPLVRSHLIFDGDSHLIFLLVSGFDFDRRYLSVGQKTFNDEGGVRNHWNGWEGHLNLTTKSTGRVNLWSGKNEQSSWSFHGRFISNMICFIHRVVAKHWDF